MKIALIPPIPELRTFTSTGIHLILSHLLEDVEYRTYYRERAEADDYIILDNSAHEFGAGNRPDLLLDQAIEVKANEVVCPDVLFDANGTYEATRSMLVYLNKNWSHYVEAGKPQLMIVPQGSNRQEWVKCLNNMLRAWVVMPDYPLGDPVIGVSKDYEPLVKGGITSLISQYLKPLNMQVHCLGWPSDLWALARVQRECPWVRSTDSAKPFVYAANEILLEPGGKVPDYPRRAPDYFSAPLTEVSRSIAKRNIEVFQAAALDHLILA